ncbi:MAG: hypothetical protein ACXWFF_17775 [Methylomonas sp.]
MLNQKGGVGKNTTSVNLVHANALVAADEILVPMTSDYPALQGLAKAICETALLTECPCFGKTIIEYRQGCRSAKDFLEHRVM